MNLRSSVHFLWLGAAIGALAAVAACGGGGAAGPAGALPAPVPSSQGAGHLKLVIKIPQPSSASSARRRPNYISGATQSIGVVVTNQGMSPSPAQFTNISNCPSVSGVTTCTVNVLAVPGSDVFAITAYSGTNGTGSALSVGSVTATIPSSGSVSPVSVSLGGVIATIAIDAINPYLPLSQTMTVNVVAQDASGASIVGTYDNPIVLSGTNLVVSPTSLPDSTTASNASVAWTQGYLGTAASTLSGTADGVTGTLTIAPASGFAFYPTGTNPNTDVTGFKMILGPNGYLYYTSLGPITCNPLTSVCSGTSGAVHQFNPTTFADTEVVLQSEGVGMHFSTDGALWIAGGPPPSSPGPAYIYRMSPGAFSSAALTAIPVPTPSPSTRTAFVRSITEDGSGNMWFVDLGGGRYMEIPSTGPYTMAAITQYNLPNGIAGTLQSYGRSRTIDYAGGVLVASDWINGSVDVISPASGLVTGQYLTSLQASFGANGSFTAANTYDAADDGTNVYLGQTGDVNLEVPNGDLEEFSPATNTFSILPTVAGPAAAEPIVPSVSGNLVYYIDYVLGGLGYVNLSSNTARLFPVSQVNSFMFPDGVAALADGTSWFSCYGSTPTAGGTTTYEGPLCVGHATYLTQWGLWPSSSISIYGAGLVLGQLMGIMESPSANSGPFTVSSSNTSVCTIANQSDHNFTIVGVAPGSCNVTVTDKNNVSQTVSAVVTTVTGVVSTRRRGGMPR